MHNTALKSSEYNNKHLGVKKFNFKLFRSQKYARNWGSEALKLRTSEKITIAELRLRSNIPLKFAELRLRTPKKVAGTQLCLYLPPLS
jgi:hypothetical protein